MVTCGRHGQTLWTGVLVSFSGVGVSNETRFAVTFVCLSVSCSNESLPLAILLKELWLCRKGILKIGKGSVNVGPPNKRRPGSLMVLAK